MSDAPQPGSDFDNVYLGFWTNWAKGSVHGLTLTTSRQSGGLLIAFLAIYVGATGRSFWRLSCLISHRLISSPAAHDALFHQRQVLLRNSDTPLQALKNVLYMALAWRGVARQPLRRLLALILWAALISLAFSAAGIFSSRVTTETASEVLLEGTKCRMARPPGGVSNANFTSAFFPFMTQQTASYLAYAQRCYMVSGKSDGCRQYVRPSIPFKVTRNTPCPFDDKMCKIGAIIVDTGFLNSNLDLGINLPKDAQFDLRMINQCAPIHSKNYTSLHKQKDLPNIPLVRYHLGNFTSLDLGILDYVYQAPANLSVVSFDGFDVGIMAQLDYEIGVKFVRGGTAEEIRQSNHINFVPELQRPDADVSLFFLSSKGILYSPQVDDPWYSAHKPSNNFVAPVTNGIYRIPIFTQDEPASILGCTSQSQICNPNGANGSTCLPLAGWLDNVYKFSSLWENPSDDTTNFLDMVGEILHAYHVYFDRVPYAAGNAALSAKQSFNFFSRLPDDQWEKEVLLWSSTSAAGLQGMFSLVAMGLRGLPLEYSAPPVNEAVKRVCRNQRIISTRFTSFNVLGIAIILIIGGAIIILDWTLEFCLDLVQRKASQHDYSRLEWKANAILQLHRMAHEAVGSGIWSKTTGAVPITSPGEFLTSWNIQDREYPRLASSEKEDPEIKLQLLAEDGNALPSSNRIHHERRSIHSEVGSMRDDSSCVYDDSESTHEESDSGMLSGQRQEDTTFRRTRQEHYSET